MAFPQLNVHNIVLVEAEAIKNLGGPYKGYSRHIIVTDNEGNELDITLFSTKEENLEVREAKVSGV